MEIKFSVLWWKQTTKSFESQAENVELGVAQNMKLTVSQ